MDDNVKLALGVGVMLLGMALWGSQQGAVLKMLPQGQAAPQGVTLGVGDKVTVLCDEDKHCVEREKGRWMLINVWASWCPPCVKEMPDVLALARQEPGLQVVLLSQDFTEKAGRVFFDKLPGVAQARNVSLFYDKGHALAFGLFGINQYPETLLVGPDGVIVQRYRGGLQQGQLAEIRGLIKG